LRCQYARTKPRNLVSIRGVPGSAVPARPETRHDCQDNGDLFVETLKDIYYAEKQILKALPGMVKKAGAESSRRRLRRIGRMRDRSLVSTMFVNERAAA